ncbi:hypothetical protein EDI_330950 [Entamoeba dispar SAW760]|uniref:Uncharacterized protein n=1 Tax=Entamoeba dispar (strain ATCC PRA-260 / SAW760) TaxID=370354 RepID=B0EUC2_ENTDS|nr:uncharacterized protein EDI_330950 [Entamoeba dispar SAW760]EDR21873.1 hypothetical protein EDI_330950 [Entamoeba dispar SAW760]|eukprot:EDR21873.1 hypothetical protein EDI_330950 [Entamoeba dispar SAW760]
MFDLESFNKILFNQESGVIFAICSNLIYNINDKECIKNAEILMKYFHAHGRLEELIIWAFNKQIITKENNKSYVNSLMTLVKLFHSVHDHQSEILNKFSPFFIHLVKIIFKRIDQLVEDKEGLIKNDIFNVMVRSIFNIVSNDIGFFKQIVGIDFYERNSKVLTFISQLITRVVGVKTTDNDILAHQLRSMLNKEVDIDNLLLSKHIMNSPDDDSCRFIELTPEIVIDIVMLMKTNALPMKKYLNNSISSQIYQSLEFFTSNIDDYYTYENLIHSLNQFVHDYYVQLYINVGQADKIEEQFYLIKEEYDEKFFELEEKKRKNQLLLERLNELKKRKGILGISKDCLKSSNLSLNSNELKSSQKKKTSLYDSSLKNMFESMEKKHKERIESLKEIREKRIEQMREKKKQIKKEWSSNWKEFKEIREEEKRKKELKKALKKEKREEKKRKKEFGDLTSEISSISMSTSTTNLRDNSSEIN